MSAAQLLNPKAESRVRAFLNIWMLVLTGSSDEVKL